MSLRQPATSSAESSVAVRPLDLSQQENTGSQFRLLQSIHETFARSLSNVLSTFLQSEMQVTFAGIRSTTMGDFQRALPNPSCLIVLKLHPEPETMILYFDSGTVLTLLDIFLGGSGLPSSPPRELTEIEWSLLEEISRVVVRSLGESWQIVKAVEFVVESLGSDPSLTPCPEPARSALKISFTLQMGEQEGHFEIAVPRSIFGAGVPVHEPPQIVEGAPSPDDIQRNARLLEDAEVELEVHLDGMRLKFGDLLALQKGQVVKFDHALDQPLRGLINGELSLSGHILSAGRKRAFQVEETSPK
jgi:flagellar motor switch protein FliM